MLGAIYGDIIGSYYEVHCTKDHDFPFMPESTFTDDTVMTAAVCRAILEDDSQIDFFRQKQRAREYAIQYKRFYSYYPNAGYGQLFSRWAQSESLLRQRSYGNGAAMRTVPIGWAYGTLKQVLIQARASCLYTHFNSEAIKGAQAVAGAVFLAKTACSKEQIRDFCEKQMRTSLSADIDEIRKEYSFDSRTKNSVPQAIIAFLCSEDYESAVRNAVSLGGDADTMACIAGGISEAYYRSIPQAISSFCNVRLDMTIKKTAAEFIIQYCT